MVTSTLQSSSIKVADEVWVATALLHREQPGRADFSPKEIEARASLENITGALRPGVYVHALQHCVANVPPNSARYRMLFETGKGRRRLYRPGDAAHSLRVKGKITPALDELPSAYHHLLDWYHEWCGKSPAADPLLALAGSGRRLWATEHGDAYVRRLREGWE